VINLQILVNQLKTLQWFKSKYKKNWIYQYSWQQLEEEKIDIVVKPRLFHGATRIPKERIKWETCGNNVFS
jgi:hypothetical protein